LFHYFLFQQQYKNPALALPIFWPLHLCRYFLAILAMGTLGKSYGIYLGYLTQISLIGSGFVVSWMFVLGLIFLGLWIMALRIGRRTDELKASKKAS
jgi:hypothetical protein